MKTSCYIQLVPKHSRGGSLLGITAKQMTTSMPRTIRDGAHLVRLDLNLPDDAFKATVVRVDIPLEKLAKEITATIP